MWLGVNGDAMQRSDTGNMVVPKPRRWFRSGLPEDDPEGRLRLVGEVRVAAAILNAVVSQPVGACARLPIAAGSVVDRAGLGA
jgi:hypothetical protein